MTGRRLSVGARLLAAFAVVAAVSVLLLTAAALVGTDRGVSAAQAADRKQAAARAATAAAAAYQRSDGWNGADLGPAQAIADAAGARLVVRDNGMMGPGHAPAGMGTQSTNDTESAAIVVGGDRVGTAVLVFGHTTAGPGRGIAWLWVAAAGGIALILAVTVGAVVARRLSRPVLQVTGAARAFARGDRSARSPTDGPGELGELAEAVNTMADQVVHTEQIRRRLAADVAHELRTPLAALQAGLEELRDGFAEPGPARLAALHDQALRLGRVVDDLAHLSAAEAAALSLRLGDADLADIAACAVAGQSPALRAAGLALHTDLGHPVPIHADPDRLHQAIMNLLANAARYCRTGDAVSVRAFADGVQAVLEVADTGPGIAAAELPHVFERLWRGSSSTSVTGTGIGLAVVRELVEAHGGTVTAGSPPSGGAVFTLRLPLARSAAAVAPRR